MNYTWIGLAIVSVVGLTKLLTWYLGPNRQRRLIVERMDELETILKKALAKDDTNTISYCLIELAKLRQKLVNLDAK